MHQSDLLIFIEALEITSVVMICIRHERLAYHRSLCSKQRKKKDAIVQLSLLYCKVVI